MEDREVLLKLIEDYPNLINSLEKVTDLDSWTKDLRNAVRSIYSGTGYSAYDVKENLKFLILYLFNKKGFFIYIAKSKGDIFLIQLGYTKEDPESMKDATTVFRWYQNLDNNEQVIREKLLKGIIRDSSPSIPKEKEMLQEVIYNCKVISSGEKRWNLDW